MGGNELARFQLGIYELCIGNGLSRSMEHLLISAKCGCDTALEMVGVGYEDGWVTKDDYKCALRAFIHSLKIRNS